MNGWLKVSVSARVMFDMCMNPHIDVQINTRINKHFQSINDCASTVVVIMMRMRVLVVVVV